jgi:hypothetical protein
MSGPPRPPDGEPVTLAWVLEHQDELADWFESDEALEYFLAQKATGDRVGLSPVAENKSRAPGI